ncbi:MAG TPA: hypothetical protein VN999_15865 [Thermoanaerobaculia bacterium]|nr:hypothetical protein [Thermoanaerobaculia bacterium]
MSVDFDVPESWPEEPPERGPASRPEETPEPAAAPPTSAGPAPTPVASPALAGPVPAAAAAPAWSLAQRIAFRFVFCYLLLYNLPFPLYLLPIPGLGAVFMAYRKFWDTVVLWTGAHVLHLAHPIQNLRGKTGSGDTTYDWVKLLCFAAFAAVATLAWTLATLRGKAREHRRLHEWLRIYVRYALGTILLSYGWAKVIKNQFPFPSQDRLLEPFGQASPMGLLWTFMGVSTPYTFFAGAMEVLGGMLLFFRRTTTLGALVTITVMTNVFMLNMCYDVPVKQYSLHLLLMAVFLLAPDLGRLANVLVLHRPTEPASLAPPWSARWARIGGMSLCVLYVGYTLFTDIQSSLEMQSEFDPGKPKATIYGTFEVEEFVRNGQTVPPLVTDASRWRRLASYYPQVLSVRQMDDTQHRFASEYSTAKHSIALSTFDGKSAMGAFTYAFPDKDHLVLQGTLLKDALTVRLRRLDSSHFLLVSRGFHWVSEYPFNR